MTMGSICARPVEAKTVAATAAILKLLIMTYLEVEIGMQVVDLLPDAGLHGNRILKLHVRSSTS